jgi:hypothetical protein
MLLTVFGAGASFDSVDLSLAPKLARWVEIESEYRPPLAAQLFDERPDFVAEMNRWPQVAPLIPRLRTATAHGGAVEEVLRKIQEEADKFRLRLSHLMALEYYLINILDRPIWKWLHAAGSSTNYVELVDKIERAYGGESGALFVTFNYDLMLELAFDSVYARQIRGIDDYVLDTAPALIKPHGSVDWVQCLPPGPDPGIPGDSADAVIESAPRLNFSGGEILKHPNPGAGIGIGQVWHPAIAIPVDRTKTFVCPDQHLARLTEDLKAVSHMLVIGWRASEAHFLDLMNKNLRSDPPIDLCIVDKDMGAVSAQESLQRALGADRFAPVELHRDGFSAFVRDDRSDEWLSAAARAPS